MYELILKPRSLKMIQEAYQWYEQQRIGLRELYLTALDTAFDKITLHPEYYHTVKEHYRQIKINQFPYVIVFELLEDEMVIYSVFHTSKAPHKKWND